MMVTVLSQQLQVVHSDGLHVDATLQCSVVQLDGLCQVSACLNDGYSLSKLITHDSGSALSLKQ